LFSREIGVAPWNAWNGINKYLYYKPLLYNYYVSRLKHGSKGGVFFHIV
jgi:hypothetical protein